MGVFGKMLKTLREEAKLSQAALAERSGLSVRSIQNWEQGHRPVPPWCWRSARAIGVPAEKLLEGIAGDEPPAPPKPRGRKKKGE